MRTPIRLAYLLRELKAGKIKREDLSEEDLKQAANVEPLFTAANIRAAWIMKEEREAKRTF